MVGMMMQAQLGRIKDSLFSSLGASWANVCSGKFANVSVESKSNQKRETLGIRNTQRTSSKGNDAHKTQSLWKKLVKTNQ
jgi:hypothetical protein